MKRVEQFFIILFFALLCLPGAQMIFGFAEEEKLHGVEEATVTQPPRFSLSDFLTERFQRHFEQWLNQSFGFRGHFVRTDNQINFSVFHELSSDYASPIVLGKENMLYEKLYIDARNDQHPIENERLLQVVQKISALQNYLESKKVVFLLLLTPSKATIYPEYIPAKFSRPIPDEKSNYQRFRNFLKQEGIHFLDSRERLLSWKEHPPLERNFPLFPKGGTHWSQHTACLIDQELVSLAKSHSIRLGQMLEFRPILCDPIEIKAKPEPFDRDLADLANIWDPFPIYEALPYPLLSKRLEDATESDRRPKMLFIGGSFLWSMLHYLDEEQIYRARDMFYYYSRRFHYPTNTIEAIDADSLSWNQDVFQNDVIILEVNEASIQKIGGGFIRDALKVIRLNKNAS